MIERVFIVTCDALRWDYHEAYRDLYPDGDWYRGTAQATFTSASHASLFTGLYPTQHGINSFGQQMSCATMFDAAPTAVSTSPISSVDGVLDANIDNAIGPLNFASLDERASLYASSAFDEWLESTEYHEEVFPVLKELDPDIAWFHDFTVHASGRYRRESIENPPVWPDDSTEVAHEKYADHIDVSVGAHEAFLDKLKEHGLYEGTLFVFWGDHGQGLGEAPLEHMYHAQSPDEAMARVPIAFVGEMFDETTIDRTTNARAIDVLPTLMEYVDWRWKKLDAEPEGVDLNSFEGELAGYSVSFNTQYHGLKDGVLTAENAYLREGYEMVLETPLVEERESFHEIQREIRNDILLGELKEHYQDVQSLEQVTPTGTAEPNEKVLEHLGYK